MVFGIACGPYLQSCKHCGGIYTDATHDCIKTHCYRILAMIGIRPRDVTANDLERVKWSIEAGRKTDAAIASDLRRNLALPRIDGEI